MVESRIIDGVVYHQNETEGYEYLEYVHTDFLWERKLSLHQGEWLMIEMEDWFGRQVLTEALFFHSREKLSSFLDWSLEQLEDDGERLLVRRDHDGELIALPESKARALDRSEDHEVALSEDISAPEDEVEVEVALEA